MSGISKTVEQALTLNIGTSSSSLSMEAAFALGNRPPSTHRRYPWDLIKTDYYKGLNLVINLNPDPNKIEDYNNKALVNKILIDYIESDEKVQKAIGVYEWGKYGPKYGKLHYHIILKTNHRKMVEEELQKLFNCRRNLRQVTITSKVIKDNKHKQDYLNYMKKEQQNKVKCLFIKNM